MFITDIDDNNYFSLLASDIQACSALNYITEILNQFCVSNFLRQVTQFFLSKLLV